MKSVSIRLLYRIGKTVPLLKIIKKSTFDYREIAVVDLIENHTQSSWIIEMRKLKAIRNSPLIRCQFFYEWNISLLMTRLLKFKKRQRSQFLFSETKTNKRMWGEGILQKQKKIRFMRDIFTMLHSSRVRRKGEMDFWDRWWKRTSDDVFSQEAFCHHLLQFGAFSDVLR